MAPDYVPAAYARWVTSYAARVREAALTEYDSRRSCVETVRIGMLVARNYGRSLRPVAVRIAALTRDWESSNGTTGHSVGTDGSGTLDPRTNGWNGHLVGILDANVYVDFAAGQFHRPAKGIVIPGPVINHPVTLAELQPPGLRMSDPADGHVWFVEATGDTIWKRFPAWLDHTQRIRRCVSLAIDAIDADTREDAGESVQAGPHSTA